MASKRDPFPVYRLSLGQVRPVNVKERHFNPTGLDGYTGPDYSARRGNTNIVGTTKPVQRFGVATGNRGEWKR